MKTNNAVYKHTLDEQETILTYDAVKKIWRAWSCVPKHIKKMQGHGWETIREDRYGTTFHAPDFAIKIRDAVKKQLSDEEKKERFSRFNSVRKQEVLNHG